MKKILYILIAAVTLLSSCVKTEPDFYGDPQITNKEGEVTLAMDLNIQGATIQDVETRAGETFAGQEKENVTKLRGFAFVFSEDPTFDDQFSDDSELLQKVEFKSITVGDKAMVYVTFKERTEGCFIRLMTCMTEEGYNEMDAFVSQEMVDAGASGPVTKFSEYKLISVGLQGYYANAETPDPTQLTGNLAFPLASPGLEMPNGITQEEIDKIKRDIYMVPVASKVDVTANSVSGFNLQEVTLLNGAKKARIRSTVLNNDDLTPNELSLPINLGGTTQYKPLAAVGNTTSATPIYFYPNNGDGPFDAPLDLEEDTNISDTYKGKNPTYLVLKGRAKGYDVDGYYKIPIRYKFKAIDAGGVVSEESDYTYNIVRNNHYKVSIIAVDNAGYSSFDEAVAGPANDVVYDIVIDDESSDDRNELIVSNNGTHYMEVKGSEVYIKSRSIEDNKGDDLGVNCSVDLKFVSPDNVPEYKDHMPKVYLSTVANSGSITILGDAQLDVAYGTSKSYKLNFNVKSSKDHDPVSGKIVVRWGELYKEIPVSYENRHALSGKVASADVNGTAVFTDVGTIEGVVNDSDSSIAEDDFSSFISSNGDVEANTTYNGRNFDGYIYPTDRSKGIRRVYYAQASNFELLDYSKTGANKEALWSVDGSKVQKIVYRSTGTIYSITDGVAQGKTETATNRREYEVKGDVNSNFDGNFDNFHPEGSWGAFVSDKKFSFQATGIGHNQDIAAGTYDPKKSQLSNSPTLTLTNFADEKKVYKFDIDQYALPYIIDESPWYCPGMIDLYGFSNRGELLGTTYVYNASYVSGEYPVGDFEWVNSETEDGYTGGDTGMKRVKPNISVDAKEVAEATVNAAEVSGTNLWRFKVFVNENVNLGFSVTGQAYFDLRITNTTDEEVYFRLVIRRRY